jgi:gamma-glutamylcyclotransferase (GGCT)/AIG2-like uncharacterized protein YtfP
MSQQTPLKVFVYGTLMRDQPNHHAYAAEPLAAWPAWIWGRLYDTGEGWPILDIPRASRLAEGSLNYVADARCSDLENVTGKSTADLSRDWYPVWGELFIFDDPQKRLPKFDELEDFSPGNPSLYDRVLTPIQALDMRGRSQRHWAWTYVKSKDTPTHWVRHIIPRWPANS